MEVIYRLKANEQLLLDDPKKVWVVQTGSFAVFATKVSKEVTDGDDPKGMGEESGMLDVEPPVVSQKEVALYEYRRYLFSVDEKAALFGAATTNPDSLSLVAVAIEATELSQISIADLVKLVATGEAEAMLQIATHVCNSTFISKGIYYSCCVV